MKLRGRGAVRIASLANFVLPRPAMPRRACRVARARAGRAQRRGDTRNALSILFTALGLLLGQTTALLHLLMVPHATCEHGELVEVHAARPEAAPAEDSVEQTRIAAATPGDIEHEHCSETARPHRIEEIGPAVGEASLLCIEPVATLGEHRETRPVAPLSLAPKSSPPSV